ncbi:hypothetical protein [Actinoalloteichus caeruleus]|nr:hypothetical protein [Actinoalloteichus caeruleus]
MAAANSVNAAMYSSRFSAADCGVPAALSLVCADICRATGLEPRGTY